MDDKQLEELMVQSFIKIMMETEKSAEGKAELAEAQKRDEQRKISAALSRGDSTTGGAQSTSVPSLLSQPPQQPSEATPSQLQQQQQQYQNQAPPSTSGTSNNNVSFFVPFNAPPSNDGQQQQQQNPFLQQQLQQEQQQQQNSHSLQQQHQQNSFLSQQQQQHEQNPFPQQQQQHQQNPYQQQGQQQQHQQQHQHQQPHPSQPDQPPYPGVVPSSALVYTTEPMPEDDDLSIATTNVTQQRQPPFSSSYGNSHSATATTTYNTLPPHSLHSDQAFSHANSYIQNHDVGSDLQHGGPYGHPLDQLMGNGMGFGTASNTDHHNIDPTTGSPRRRREGRDHTNFVLPPVLDPFIRDVRGVKVDGSTGQLSSFGPDTGGESGLQLIVLDKTDDESDNDLTVHPPSRGGDGGMDRQNGGSDIASHNSRSNSHVFPVDSSVVERDMFKQEYTPPPKNLSAGSGRKISQNGFVRLNHFKAANSRNNTSHSGFHTAAKTTLADDPSRSKSMNDGIYTHNQMPENYGSNGIVPQLRADAFSTDFDTERADVDGSGGGNVGQGQTWPFVYNVTDVDSDLETTSRYPTGGNLQQQPPGGQMGQNNLTVPVNQRRSNKHHRHHHPVPHQQGQKPVFAISHADYERFTSVPPGISTVREEIGRRDTGRRPGVPDDRTFVLHPDLGTMVPGAGFKFLVDRQVYQKRASRANILSRAERLLDARRGHVMDRSDSSDEAGKAPDDDDDELTDMEDAKHRALRHVNTRQRRVYEDSASSDDVLHTIRHSQRGPLSVAARRARLTSFNARLNKQKRGRAYRRKALPPPGQSDDDDLNSSGSDAMDSGYNQPWPDDDERYEESNLQDISNGNGRRQQNYLGSQQQQQKEDYKGKRVWFFRNGDIHYRPKQVLINTRIYQSMEYLLVGLSQLVETSTGVKHVFSWPEGKEIKSLTEFQNGKHYVCASTCKLQRVDYGNSREGVWKLGKIDRNENFLFQKNGKVQSPLRRPRVLTIISNMYRDSREKLILNTNSQMNFEDILTDIVNMVNIPNPPVRALYTERRPYQQVQSYSQLIRDFADHDNFLACGEEMVPLEMASNGSNGKRGGQSVPGSVDGSRPGAKRNARSEIGRIQEDRDLSPGRSSDFTTAKGHGQGQSKGGRRRKTDSVRVDINGKTREFFPPTTIDEDDDGSKPDKKLRLDWVYGFRGRDVKQNLVVLPSSGELVYFVAAVVVLYDKKFASQKHYLGHSEEVTCLAVHPNGRFVATGQNAGKTLDTGAHVRVWDGVSLSTYAVIGLGSFQVGVTTINFSERDAQGANNGSDMASGDLLMAIDDSDRHVLTVWEWQTEKMVARTTTTTDPVVSGCFFPMDESILVTYGREHVHFWRLFWDKGRKVMRDRLSGNFEEDVPKFVTSLCFSPTGDVITGDSTGAILIWSRDNNSVFAVNEDLSLQTRKAHKKSVSALCMLGDGTLLSGGGNEVKAWDSISNYCLVKERVLPESAGHVRSLVPMSAGGLDGSIFVSTTRNKVLEGSLQLKFKVVIQGHVEELWAVESHPLEQTFVSAGHDQTVVKWSAISHAPVWRVNVENPCTSISIDPKGRLIALGTTAGKVVVLNSYNGIQLDTLLVGGAQVNALSFSPDGKRLSVGTFDGLIQIYYLTDEGQKFFSPDSTALKHNNMFIMHMDWSVDSKFIQACLGDYDLIYWDLTSLQKVKASRSMRDVKWATHNCPIGHSVIGAWQNLDRGEVINVVSRSQYRDMTVVGDSRGRARLYRWPCSHLKSGFHNTKAYSSNVTCATFTCDDAYVITSGGNDAALMQFSVLDPVST